MVRVLSLPLSVLVVILAGVGCAASEGSGVTPGHANAGGSENVGGTPSTGGQVSATGGAATGVGGQSTTSVGGNAATGGTSAAGGNTTTLTKFVGNITTDNGCDTGGLSFAKYWNQITPENSGKWGSVQSSATSSFNWSALDAIYDYAQKNNVIFKQHTFVWGSQQPSGTISEANVKNWITTFCQRYPNTKIIDVVNEPPPHTTPSYANNIGGGTDGTWQWITNAFTWARAACPNAILLMNDYNNIEWTTDNAHFIDIVKTIKAAGAPIDAIGAQAHDLDNDQVTTDTVKALLAKLNSDTGLPIYITEYDISTTDDTVQLNKYKEHIPFFLSTDYIKGITIWGWIYGKTWSQAPNSGLIKSPER
jgi:endo-1,4-beta-xylanase